MRVRADPEPELLLAHSAWIRGLARRLAGAEAEDLVQDAWVAALERPRTEVRSLRGWLAGLVTNLAREVRRGEGRRRLREQRSARAARSSEPSVAETFEAVATGRELADLVLELEEPFRTVVLLRYYEDQPPRRIALALGVPVRTVNSRLARGLERLRERWKLRHHAAGGEGDAWVRSLLFLAGAGPALPTSAAASGAILPLGVALMNTKIWLGAAVLGAGAAALWLTPSHAPETRRAELSPPPASEVAARPGPETHEPLDLAPPDIERRSAVEARAERPVPSAQTATAPAAPSIRRLRGRVLDPEARPLAGIEVGYSPSGGGEPVVATSGLGGFFELEATRGSGELRATDPALVTVMRGSVNEHTQVDPLVVVAPRIELAGVVLDESGAPLGEVRVRCELPRGFRTRFEAVLDATEGGGWRAQTDERGRFELAPVPAITGSTLVAELEGFEPWREELPWRGERDLVLTLVRSAAAVPVVVGRVVDAEHRSVAGAWVSLGGRSTATDAAGEFRLERDDAREALELRAMKSGYRLARLRALEDASGQPAWPAYVVLVLGAPPLALAGRVVDTAGEPRADMRLWIADPTPFGVLEDDMLASAEYYLAKPEHGDAYWSSLFTDSAGRFRIEGLLERDYSVRVMNPRTLEIHQVGPFQAGREDVEIVFADRAPGRILGRVITREGRELAGVKVRLLGHAFGGVYSDAASALSDSEGRFRLEDIAGEGLMLAVSGDDVMPNWTPVEVPPGGELELDLPVAVRCTFQVDLGRAKERADALRVLDEGGAALTLYRIGPSGSYRTEEFPILEGRSDSLGVDERAHTLLLLKGGAEVGRVPLDLRPGTLNLVTP